MFREMRRKKQQLSKEESIEILQRATSGVLAVSGDGGYPYAVPLSYVYYDGAVWFHCAKAGHKLDAVRQNGKVSFCVIGRDEVIPEKLTTAYRSVIVFGTAHIVEDEGEIRRAAQMLGEKYAPDLGEGIPREIDGALPRMAVIRLNIDHMTGKEGIELAPAEEPHKQSEVNPWTP